MLHDQTLEEAVDVIREKLNSRTNDEEYQDAIDTLQALWDDERIAEMNNAIAPLYHRPPDNRFVYIMLNVRGPYYILIARNKQWKTI